jgi:hypothetical protein
VELDCGGQLIEVLGVILFQAGRRSALTVSLTGLCPAGTVRTHGKLLTDDVKLKIDGSSKSNSTGNADIAHQKQEH